ncbi:MAG: methylmalonyl-CoA mutase family protein [Planctomycetes bacterium]|nr:methylmalonyl-CoA mutase family protein [Planctomycetota bacterium]
MKSIVEAKVSPTQERDPSEAAGKAETRPSAAESSVYPARNKIRIVTATALFDGHDASINIMRRICQSSGAEVIHLGHNRSVQEIVDAAIQEDVQAIAVTSYQGGHIEFFTYMHDTLVERGCGHVRIFGGGGGVILPHEVEALHAHGITRIYSPDDGRKLGLVGMIHDMLARCDFPTGRAPEGPIGADDHRALGQALTVIESDPAAARRWLDPLPAPARTAPVLGVTGTGGAGKSSVIDELVRRFRTEFPDLRIAILSVDPSRRRTGGALLGDRIRMNAIGSPRVYMRSMATRQAHLALSPAVPASLSLLRKAGFDLVILETAGIGQSDTEITGLADVSLYVMTPEYGAATQLEKIDMLDYADLVAINKFDRRGALDALRDVRKQWRRNRQAHTLADDQTPVFGTIASTFHDAGTNRLYHGVLERLRAKSGRPFVPEVRIPDAGPQPLQVLPPARVRYLAEIAENNRRYDAWADGQSAVAQRVWQLRGAAQALRQDGTAQSATTAMALEALAADQERQLAPECREALAEWPDTVRSYRGPMHVFHVRGKAVQVEQQYKTLSGLSIPKVALPRYEAHGDLLRWILQENVPGEFPFTAGVYPFKREEEDPTRMFAGEGGPERTNKRFHYLSRGQQAKRLSTAFDSVTLYGEDPARRPDIYGKVGNSGVSICTLDDAKKLYSGFDLADPRTSVSMTINGPAPMLLGFFLNAAIDQQCEKHIRAHGMVAEVERRIAALYAKLGTPQPRYTGELPEGNDGLGLLLLGVTGDQVLPREVYDRIRAETLKVVRGTVQADILKEDQAQNTCIFSTEFALRMMGDIQQYFVHNEVRNFYSVSISGYHIAEAGANPITQLAFTLANGFTLVEYYLARGMQIDDFAPNLSFFFSNGIDPEYSVIGRVARRIWAKAMRLRYGGNERSQKLKYHIQTSGRSLHAQEIAFNDIRTTLQALYAIYDNCNSLHTNAYDEAITTPTEESVRRAMAIQLIINRELGLAKNENPLQGSFVIEELSDLVEEAVLREFERISERGGVLGAMETMYQRGRIQEESLHYESLKASGELPIVGVNTFLGSDGSPILVPEEVARSTTEEKEQQLSALAAFQRRNAAVSGPALERLRAAAWSGANVFESLMETTKVCSLGQISAALYDVGGQYRRSM